MDERDSTRIETHTRRGFRLPPSLHSYILRFYIARPESQSKVIQSRMLERLRGAVLRLIDARPPTVAKELPQTDWRVAFRVPKHVSDRLVLQAHPGVWLDQGVGPQVPVRREDLPLGGKVQDPMWREGLHPATPKDIGGRHLEVSRPTTRQSL